ncbi:hypothetical protein XO10_10350 [Marinitoga sp. 1135]|uniref:ComEC/Rec2 family competence protein n=1 Tax=Marinitoga sp. 1135 TaxID=1643333 RepID=UPI001586EE66|nr:ComEC/Rec2 family competence protein [Marinitoga sp. 1135]NUU96625.1 hypothetical protein [Marinitoga sp. 1135]
MPFFVTLFSVAITIILLIKVKMITTAIIFMAVVFFINKYSLKTKVLFLIIIGLIVFRTLFITNVLPDNLNNIDLGILGYITDKNYNQFKVKTEKIFFENKWVDYNKTLYFNYNKFSVDPFEIGNKVYIYGSYLNGRFNAEYMANSNEGSIYSIRNYFKKRIYNHYDYSTNNILFSILFGGISPTYSKIYKEAGLLHLFAVSGFHVYLLYFAIYYIFSKTLIHIHYRRIFTIIILLFYLAASGFSPSATRAVLLLIFVELSKIFGFNIDTLNLLGIVGIINLLYNPYSILSPGFLMSYFASFSILFSLKYTKNPFIITLSAYLAVAPWSIIFFNGISLLGIFLSIIITPIIYAIMFFGVIAILFPIPHFLGIWIDYSLKGFNEFLIFLNSKIPYIIFNDNSAKFISYFISIIILFLFHMIKPKIFSNRLQEVI